MTTATHLDDLCILLLEPGATTPARRAQAAQRLFTALTTTPRLTALADSASVLGEISDLIEGARVLFEDLGRRVERVEYLTEEASEQFL